MDQKITDILSELIVMTKISWDKFKVKNEEHKKSFQKFKL